VFGQKFQRFRICRLKAALADLVTDEDDPPPIFRGAIDYLETRPEVDASRIGMTGRSGGAAMSWFTAAVDPRVKVVAPVMGISTYAANVRDNTQRLHCDCMFTINSAMHDMLHQGALIAPRPLLMMHGKQDLLFPVAGYEEFQDKVGALYRSLGAPGEFGNIVVDTGHQDSEFLRAEAIRWFDRHLRKIPERKLDLDYSDAPEDSLAVFSGRPPSAARNYRVHETFTTAGPMKNYSSLAAWTARRDELVSLLRTKVFAAFPTQAVDPAVQRSGRDLEFTSEPGITVRALLIRPSKFERPEPAILYVASDAEDARAVTSVFNGIQSGVRMAVYPRGVGVVPWDKSFWKDTLRNAMHTGRTVDSMRLYDVLRAIDVLRAEPGVDPARIMLAGRGVSGALALYSAILDPRVHQVTLIDAPSSHTEGPVFLNVMRHTDLPEAAALLAPRHLNFYARMPAAYEPTRRIYAIHGQADRVFLTMNLWAVLEGRYDHNFGSGR
ncbi:MAG: acetylxylan esterase, partial [Bryobacteraceae bacterium]